MLNKYREECASFCVYSPNYDESGIQDGRLRARGDRKRKREREIGFWRTMASLC